MLLDIHTMVGAGFKMVAISHGLGRKMNGGGEMNKSSLPLYLLPLRSPTGHFL